MKLPFQPKTTLLLLVCAICLASSTGCRQTPKRAVAAIGTAATESIAVDTAAPVSLPNDAEAKKTLTLVAHQSRIDDEERPSKGVKDKDDVIPLRLPEDIAAPAPAETTETELTGTTSQSVEYFVGIAMANHPRIRAARARVAAAAQRAPQAEALEDPTLTNSFYPISDQALQTAAGRAGNTMSVAQKYPWPEKRWTKAAIADRETQMAASRLAQVELEIEEMVRLAYYELWFADRAISITEENREIAVELVKLSEARYEAGGRQQDVLRAELQRDSLEDRLIGLRRQKAVAQADLAALVQQPGLMDIEPTEEIYETQIPAQLDALFAAAEQCSPRLRERQWAVSRDRQKQQLACLNKYPDFTFGAGWQTITETDAVSRNANGHDNVNFMVGVTLPIWRDKIDASIREASAEAAASSREYKDCLLYTSPSPRDS